MKYIDLNSQKEELTKDFSFFRKSLKSSFERNPECNSLIQEEEIRGFWFKQDVFVESEMLWAIYAHLPEVWECVCQNLSISVSEIKYL